MKKLLGILVMGLLLTGCRSFSNVNEASHNINMRAKYAEFAVKRPGKKIKEDEGHFFYRTTYNNSLNLYIKGSLVIPLKV